MNRRKQPKAHRKGYAMHMQDIASYPKRVDVSKLTHIHINTIAKQYLDFFESIL